MKTSTKATASLLFNNLAADDKHLGYIHGSDVVIVSESAVSSGQSSPAVTKVTERDAVLVEQARWVCPPDVPIELLVIASRRSLSIYTSDGKTILHSIGLSATETEERPAFFRGIGACNAGSCSYIFGGSWTGELYQVPVVDATSFGNGSIIRDLEGEVIDLTATSLPAFGVLAVSAASVPSTGKAAAVYVLEVFEDGVCELAACFESEPDSICTTLRLKDGRLICGYCTGHIRLFDLASRAMSAVINAHARCINAIDVHPSGPFFASAAEDSTVGVWVLEDQAAQMPVRQLAHLEVKDTAFTGVAFCGGSKDCLAATAYDVDYIHAWSQKEWMP